MIVYGSPGGGVVVGFVNTSGGHGTWSQESNTSGCSNNHVTPHNRAASNSTDVNAILNFTHSR